MSYSRNEIELMLRKGLKTNILGDYCLKSMENQNLPGYMSDIIFVQICGFDNSSSRKTYDLALKCRKKYVSSREAERTLKISFQNEIYVYNKVWPAFRKFELGRLHSVFDNIPKGFGTYSDPNMDMIILEDLKSTGNQRWDITKSLTRPHLEIVLEAYGELHAISTAFRDQEPAKFAKLAENLQNIWLQSEESFAFCSELVGPRIKIAVELLKNEIAPNVCEKWLDLGRQVKSIVYELTTKTDCFTVISHGDCWTSNFMFKYENNGKSGPIPVKATMLDWQISSVYSPVMDISYFLYTSISPQDLEDFDSFLKLYYTSFSRHVELLGSDPNKLYPYKSFVDDFKAFAKFGAMMAPPMINISLLKPQEGPDISKSSTNGDPFMDCFNVITPDIESLKNRLKALMEHAVEREFL